MAAKKCLEVPLAESLRVVPLDQRGLDVDRVEVVLQVETRGPEYCGDVISALRASGCTLVFA